MNYNTLKSNKLQKGACTVIALLALACTANTALADDGLSFQSLACESSDQFITMTVLMPNSFTLEEMETESQRICDSMKIAGTTYPLAPGTAVCDTDMNCEWYDRYKNTGIAGIYIAETSYQLKYKETNPVLEVHCIQHDITKFIRDTEELPLTCKNPINIANEFKKDWVLEKPSRATIAINHYELEYLIKIGMTSLNEQHNDGPTHGAILELMQQHPEIEASAAYREGESIDIDAIHIRFPKDRSITPTWLVNFCTNANDSGSDSQQYCWWD